MKQEDRGSASAHRVRNDDRGGNLRVHSVVDRQLLDAVSGAPFPGEEPRPELFRTGRDLSRALRHGAGNPGTPGLPRRTAPRNLEPAGREPPKRHGNVFPRLATTDSPGPALRIRRRRPPGRAYGAGDNGECGGSRCASLFSTSCFMKASLIRRALAPCPCVVTSFPRRKIPRDTAAKAGGARYGAGGAARSASALSSRVVNHC